MSETQPAFDPPLLVVVTGPPATGKSTVAEELATRLRVPFISKDLLKEALYDTFGYGDDLEEKLDRAALALLFTVVEASSQTILRNFADRAESGRRHPGHQDEPEDVAEVRAKLDAGLWDPLDLPDELIELPVLETDVDYDAVARQVRELASRAATG